MSKFVWKNAVITVNGVDLSDHANEVTLEDTANEVDATGFGTNGYTEILQGLKDATVTATFFQDFGTASVHATLNPLYISGGTFDVTVKPSTASVSATNPQATMTARLLSYGGLGGAVGDAATVQCSFRNAGNGITWGTA